MFRKCSENVPKMFQKSSKNIPKMFQRCSKIVSKMFQKCSKNVLKKFQKSSKKRSKKFQKSLKKVPKKFQKVPEKVQSCQKNCQVMSPHRYDQMSQRSHVSGAALCRSKSKGGSLSQSVTMSPIELSDSRLDSCKMQFEFKFR